MTRKGNESQIGLLPLTVLHTPPHLFSPEKAEALAETLRSEDPEWTYEVRHDPAGTGFSFIEVYDEDGEFVGRA